MSGVRPMLAELSSNTGKSDLPVQDEFVLLLGPGAQKVGERFAVDDVGNGAVDLLPNGGEGRLGLAALAPSVLGPLDVTKHLADADGFGRSRQEVAALSSAARFHKTALFQAGQDEFEELLRNA